MASCWTCPHVAVADSRSGRSHWYVCGKLPNRPAVPDPADGVPEWCPLREAKGESDG